MYIERMRRPSKKYQPTNDAHQDSSSKKGAQGKSLIQEGNPSRRDQTKPTSCIFVSVVGFAPSVRPNRDFGDGSRGGRLRANAVARYPTDVRVQHAVRQAHQGVRNLIVRGKADEKARQKRGWWRLVVHVLWKDAAAKHLQGCCRPAALGRAWAKPDRGEKHRSLVAFRQPGGNSET